MKIRITIAFLVALAFAGCETTQKVLTTLHNWSLGSYRATPQQIAISENRAAKAYEALPEQKKTEMKDSGPRYLAVRTADPTPQQMAEIKKEVKKPGGRYSSGGKMPSKIYCVMIWDTYSKQIVGNDCYATSKLPDPMEIAKFETYTAIFVGGNDGSVASNQ